MNPGAIHVRTSVAIEVLAHATTRPHKTALSSEQMSLTYSELADRVERYAGDLRQRGVGPGTPVVLVAPSVVEFAIAYYALHYVGARVITVNTMSTPRELEHIAQDAVVELVVAWHAHADTARLVCSSLGVPLVVLEAGGRIDGPREDRPHLPATDDIALVLYSSGTSGQPKGVELSVGNLLACAACFVPGLSLTPEDCWGTALPLFHVFGQCVVMNTALVAGAAVFLQTPFDPAALLGAVSRHGVTLLSGVPTMWNALIQHARTADRPEVAFAGLRAVTSGGSSLSGSVIAEFTSLFGCALLEGYGLTETTGAATFNDLRFEQRIGTVGRALPGIDIQVRDATGTVLGPGQVGEVFIAGPTVTRGYWSRPEETANALAGGWVATGDLGSLDTEGYLSIADRLKDMIIRGGYNVYPREVEEALSAHPDVVQAAVIGVPDDYYGQEVAAVVTLREGARADAEGLFAWCNTQLSPYKSPRLFTFVEALPQNASGKTLKRVIDTSHVAQTAQRVGRRGRGNGP